MGLAEESEQTYSDSSDSEDVVSGSEAESDSDQDQDHSDDSDNSDENSTDHSVDSSDDEEELSVPIPATSAQNDETMEARELVVI